MSECENEYLFLQATLIIYYLSVIMQMCEAGGGVCQTLLDGYYVENALLVVVGLVWARWGIPTIRRLQDLPASVWAITHRNTQ